MRINKYIALATGLSRRASDAAIASGRVKINQRQAQIGDTVKDSDVVSLDDHHLSIQMHRTILLHKPVGYVSSRDGQGSKTVYDLLPQELHALKLVGRLDKNSSGLLLLTSDGTLAHRLTHPSFNKTKVYEVTLDKPLVSSTREQIETRGVDIGDVRNSSFTVEPMNERTYRVLLQEGRNRQIRRTFEALGYTVVSLHRTAFGDFELGNIQPAEFTEVAIDTKN